MTAIELYRLPGCPYCAKVESKLDELELEYVTQDVPGPRSQRTEVEQISGQQGVPVLVDPANDVTGMAESAEIVRHLESAYN